MYGYSDHSGIWVPKPRMASPLADHLGTKSFQCPDHILRLQGRKSSHDALDFNFMDADEFWQVDIALILQAQLDDLFDIYHQFIQGFALCVAASQLGHLPSKESVFVFLDNYVECAVSQYSLPFLGLSFKSSPGRCPSVPSRGRSLPW